MSNAMVGSYAVANGLVGFRSSELRVKVTRVQGPYAWVVTADLLDAGTFLTLDASQVTPVTPEAVGFHRDGLVAFNA